MEFLMLLEAWDSMKQQLAVACDKYKENPLSESAQAELQAEILRQVRTDITYDFKEWYNMALDTVAANPHSDTAKTFALSLGKWHYAGLGLRRSPNRYDESAALNDIEFRSR